MFVELVERSKGARAKIVNVTDVDAHMVRNHQAFTSIFPFGEGIFSHMKMTTSPDYPHGTVEGYQGVYHCRNIIWDLDDEPAPMNAMLDARRLVNTLVTKYGVPQDGIATFFSGNKGFHVVLRGGFFGGFEPSENLPYKIGEVAQHISDQSGTRNKTLETFDTSIYKVNAIIRLPNSKHEVTGLYKIPLTFEELATLGIKEVKELAKKPRPDFGFPKVQVVVNSKLQQVWQLVATEPETTPEDQKILSTIGENQTEAFATAVRMTQRRKEYGKGNRNEYVHLLAQWCNDLGLGMEGDGEVIWDEAIKPHLEAQGERWNERGHENETHRTVVSVYHRKQREWGKNTQFLKENRTKRTDHYETKIFLNDWASRLARSGMNQKSTLTIVNALNETRTNKLTQEQVYQIVTTHVEPETQRPEDDLGKDMGDIMAEFLERTTSAKRGPGTGFRFIDDCEDSEFESRVIGIIANGGVGKSRMLKQIAMNVASAEGGYRALASTMEDSPLNWGKRVMNSTMDAEWDTNTHSWVHGVTQLKNGIKNGKIKKEDWKGWVEAMRTVYGNRLMLDGYTGMSGKSYKDLVEKHLKSYGSLYLLGVDGLSMMDDDGNELSSAIKNSRDLKMVANEYDILVMPLIHVPNDVPRDKRDLFDNTRGGAKVMENLDGYISLSMIKIDSKSGPGSEVYWDQYIFASYWGKRMSGKRSSCVLELDQSTMTYQETALTLKDLKRMEDMSDAERKEVNILDPSGDLEKWDGGEHEDGDYFFAD